MAATPLSVAGSGRLSRLLLLLGGRFQYFSMNFRSESAQQRSDDQSVHRQPDRARQLELPPNMPESDSAGGHRPARY